MGTTNSVSNPVACLRSNCVPYGGPTSFEYRAKNANRKAMDRPIDGVQPILGHSTAFETPKDHHSELLADQKQRSMVRGEHTTFVDRGLSPEILGTEVGKTFSGRKIWLHSKRI